MAIASSVNSPADVVNLALVRLGKTERVGNLYDGSPAAKRFLDIYGQTRDAVLCELAWDFADRNIALTLLKTAPQNGYFPPTVWNPAVHPPMPWYYEYAYPSDGLNIKSLRPVAVQTPNFDPKPVLYELSNDNLGNPAPGKVILTNIPGAIANYTARITEPTSWKPSFVEALVSALARRIAGASGGEGTVKLEAQDEQAALAIATPDRG